MTPLQQATALGSAMAGSAAGRRDGDIVHGLRRGDPEAFATLFTAYRLPVYNFVARMVGDPEDAKDITQEVFLKAFRQLPRGDGDLNVRPWLYRVATTTCLDHLRARKRRAETTPIDGDEYPAVGDTYEQAEVGRLVEQTLGNLSERHRLALVLKDLHGLQHGEIASILGVSRGATETLLFRARAAFRHAFLALSAPTEGLAGCPEARRAALMLIERDSSPLTKRRFIEHARTCPECRAALKSTAPGAAGLALFLPALQLPGALRVWHAVGGSHAAVASHGAAAAAGSGSGAAGSAGVSGAALSAAGTGTTAGTATAAATSTGLIAQVTAVIGTKVALIAIAVTATAAAATVSTNGLPTQLFHAKHAAAPPPAALQGGGPQNALTTTSQGRHLGRGHSPKPAGAVAKGHANGTSKAHAVANGKAAAKAAKAAKNQGKAKGTKGSAGAKAKGNGASKAKGNGATKAQSSSATKTKAKGNGSTKSKDTGSAKTKSNNGNGKGHSKG